VYLFGRAKIVGEQEIPGLTDTTVPRRLGPKRASKIRKLFNLKKEDDVRQYVVRRPLPVKEGMPIIENTSTVFLVTALCNVIPIFIMVHIIQHSRRLV